jgi:hypothetical protein
MSVVGTKSRWDEVVCRWLSAPLLITVVGALLINFVIPQITTNSQNHQRALDRDRPKSEFEELTRATHQVF